MVATSNELLGAVRELTGEVKRLRTMLNEEYPKRVEVRAVMRRKTISYGLTILMVLVAAQIMTMTTVGHCFLISTANPPFGCTLIPGYSAALKQGDERLRRFYEISENIEDNRVKIAELELEIEKLKTERQGH